MVVFSRVIQHSVSIEDFLCNNGWEPLMSSLTLLEDNDGIPLLGLIDGSVSVEACVLSVSLITSRTVFSASSSGVLSIVSRLAVKWLRTELEGWSADMAFRSEIEGGFSLNVEGSASTVLLVEVASPGLLWSSSFRLVFCALVGLWGRKVKRIVK